MYMVKTYGISNYINVKIFLASLFFGIFLSYITTDPKQVILVFPTPENNNKISYKDKSENCYHYNPVEVICPEDKSKLSEYSIQN